MREKACEFKYLIADYEKQFKKDQIKKKEINKIVLGLLLSARFLKRANQVFNVSVIIFRKK